MFVWLTSPFLYRIDVRYGFSSDLSYFLLFCSWRSQVFSLTWKNIVSVYVGAIWTAHSSGEIFRNASVKSMRKHLKIMTNFLKLRMPSAIGLPSTGYICIIQNQGTTTNVAMLLEFSGIFYQLTFTIFCSPTCIQSICSSEIGTPSMCDIKAKRRIELSVQGTSRIQSRNDTELNMNWREIQYVYERRRRYSIKNFKQFGKESRAACIEAKCSDATDLIQSVWWWDARMTRNTAHWRRNWKFMWHELSKDRVCDLAGLQRLMSLSNELVDWRDVTDTNGHSMEEKRIQHRVPSWQTKIWVFWVIKTIPLTAILQHIINSYFCSIHVLQLD